MKSEMSNFDEGPPIASQTNTKSTVAESAGFKNVSGNTRTITTGNHDKQNVIKTKNAIAKLWSVSNNVRWLSSNWKTFESVEKKKENSKRNFCFIWPRNGFYIEKFLSNFEKVENLRLVHILFQLKAMHTISFDISENVFKSEIRSVDGNLSHFYPQMARKQMLV